MQLKERRQCGSASGNGAVQTPCSCGSRSGIHSYDEKQEYADVEEAVTAGKQYLADGYSGFSVFNHDTKIIEHTEGEFDVESAYSVDVLKANNLTVALRIEASRFYRVFVV